jgi:hypothetical protein
MLKIASGLAAAAVLATFVVMMPTGAEARDRAAIRACGGPARSYNQCIAVCGCMGGQRCYARCGTRDFSKAGRAMKRGMKGKRMRGGGIRGGNMRGGFR